MEQGEETIKMTVQGYRTAVWESMALVWAVV